VPEASGVLGDQTAGIGRGSQGACCRHARRGTAAVEREAARASQLVVSKGNRHADGALERFCDLREKLGAQPAAYVSYVREAYVSPASDHLRVTFDRQVSGSPFAEARRTGAARRRSPVDFGGVVLEIKFMDRFPSWLRELVWAFNLQRRAASKYVHGVEAWASGRPAGFASLGKNCPRRGIIRLRLRIGSRRGRRTCGAMEVVR